jgi:hypothetical protein
MRTHPELVPESRGELSSKLPADGLSFDFPAWPETARALAEASRSARR